MVAGHCTIRRLMENDKAPYHLLLLADPSRQAVDEYLQRGICYLASYKNEIIGVYILLRTRPFTMEVVNLAVKEEFQGKGIGKKLLLDALCKARDYEVKTLELGTGNSSLRQLGLYQKCGFRIVGVDKDFFVKHYNDVIIENGIRCIDMIRLRINL
jgi:ribosomal protein S18 acetylase RimI-like enzyme